MDQDNLENRVEALEAKVKKLEKNITGALMQSQPVHQYVEHTYSQEPVNSEPNWFTNMLNWLKEDWLMKLGAFILLLALAWFVTYAFAQNWIGPIGRISLGMLTGVGIMLAGHLVMAKRSAPGQVLAALGMTMLLVTIFSARFIYDFFTPATSLGMMGIVVIATALIAIIRNARALGILAILGGAIAPLLTNSSEPDHFALMSYVFILGLGAFLITLKKQWRELLLLSLLVTFVYSLESFYQLDGKNAVYVFMGLFYSLFLFSNLFNIVKSKYANIADLLTAGLNSIVMLIWIGIEVPENWTSIISSIVALATVSISFLLILKSQVPKKAIYIHSAAALMFVAAASAFELDGYPLIIAFYVEAFLAILLATKLIKREAPAISTSILLLPPLIMTLDLYSYQSWVNENVFNATSLTLLVGTIAVFGSAFVLNAKEFSTKFISIILSYIGAMMSIILIWRQSILIFENFDVARGVALVIYTVVGVAMYFSSIDPKRKQYRIFSAILLGGVVLRLLLVEVWAMPVFGRVITFVAIGALLVATAFVEKKTHSHNN